MIGYRSDLGTVAAMVAAAVAMVMLFVYLGIMRQEADSPAPWFVAALVLGVVAAGYGANPPSPHRGSALMLAGSVLAAIGVLVIFSIGLPILLAGALCLLAGVRSAARPPSWHALPPDHEPAPPSGAATGQTTVPKAAEGRAVQVGVQRVTTPTVWRVLLREAGSEGVW